MLVISGCIWQIACDYRLQASLPSLLPEGAAEIWDESVKGTDPQLYVHKQPTIMLDGSILTDCLWLMITRLMISRLDTGCAGMCLVARSAAALALLQVKAREGQLIHTFVALVHGRCAGLWAAADGVELALPPEDPNGGGSQRQRRKAKAAERVRRAAVAAAVAAGEPPPAAAAPAQRAAAAVVDHVSVRSVEDFGGNGSDASALSTVRLSCVSTQAIRYCL